MWELVAIIGEILLFILLWRWVPVARAYLKRMDEQTAFVQEHHAKQLEAYREGIQLNRHQAEIETIIERMQNRRTLRRRGLYKGAAQDGYVYLINMNNEFYKIGYASDVTARFGSIQTSTPYKLELIHVIISQDAPRLEHILHQRYAAKRDRGEWFRLEEGDIIEIRSILSPATISHIREYEQAWKDQP